jgi:toxin ParE1/3/4
VEISWTESAIADLVGIRAYVGQFNPLAARRMAEALISAGNGLVDFPERGRVVARGRRELTVVWPYVIRYRIENERVVILRVRHGKRRPLRD